MKNFPTQFRAGSDHTHARVRARHRFLSLADFATLLGFINDIDTAFATDQAIVAITCL
jgi:hypothetical protein